jgi:endonuclease G
MSKPSVKPFLALISILVSPSYLIADVRSVHCPIECPANPQGNDLVFAHLYALSNNPKTKFADWVAYEVDVLNFGDTPGRKWKADPLLEDEETLEPDDYKSANSSSLKADRGHQAPLASFAGSRYWSELNYLSNITPQHKDLNQGPWKNLEDAVRKAVKFRSSLFVITGPVFEGEPLALPKADEPHQVPSGYFKVIYNMKGESVSFFMPQSMARSADYCSAKKSLDKISTRVKFKLPNFSESDSLLQMIGCS